MPRKSDEVLAEALELPVDARARIAESLIVSLDEQEQDADPATLHAAWLQEASRRLKEIESGPAHVLDADVVFRAAHEELRALRSSRRRP